MSAIYLVRHGQASFGRANYDNLSDLGEEQARVLGRSLRTRIGEVHAAASGTMVRHQQTARACLGAMGLTLTVEQDAGFNEFDHDELIARYKPRYANRLVLAAELASTFKPRKAFQEMFAQAVERWVSGQHDHEYKETWSDFRARVTRALERLAERLDKKQTALVFTSGGPITAVVQSLLHIPDHQAFKLNWTLVNCAVTKVLVGSQGLHLSCVNDHAHLEGSGPRLITYR